MYIVTACTYMYIHACTDLEKEFLYGWTNVKTRHNFICQPQYLLGLCLHAKFFLNSFIHFCTNTKRFAVHKKMILWKANNYKRGKKLNVLMLSFKYYHCYFEASHPIH